MARHVLRIARATALILLLSACAADQPAEQRESGPPPSAAASAASPSATTEASAVSSPSEAAEQTLEISSPVAFSITVPSDWEKASDLSSSTTQTLRAGTDRWLIFTQAAPSTADEWIERLSSDANLTTSEPDVVELAGASGVTLDVSLQDEEGQVVLFREAFGEWSLEAGRPHRVWILEVGGELLVILTDAPERAFDSWVATVEDVLATIVWAE